MVVSSFIRHILVKTERKCQISLKGHSFYIITRYLPFIASGLFACNSLSADSASRGGPRGCLGLQLKELTLIIVLNDTSRISGQVIMIQSLDLLYTMPWFIVLGCTEVLFMRRSWLIHWSIFRTDLDWNQLLHCMTVQHYFHVYWLAYLSAKWLLYLFLFPFVPSGVWGPVCQTITIFNNQLLYWFHSFTSVTGVGLAAMRS